MYKVTSKDYAFLGLLTLINTLNFVDRSLLASFANFIVPDLALTNTQFGYLVGLAFLFFYSIMGLFMGALADTVHRPRLIAFGVALWSIFTAASGAAKGFISMAVPRMFIGVGESILTPSAVSSLSDRFPDSRMGFVIGIYYMGIPLGAGLSLVIAGTLGPIIGWRNCFYILGGVGLFLALIMWFVPETPRLNIKRDITQEDNITFKERFHLLFETLIGSPVLMYIISAGVIVHITLGGLNFDQLWLVQERGYERAEIAILAGILVLFAGVAGNLFGGVMGDLFVTKFNQPRAMFLFWIGLITAPFAIVYRLVEGGSPWIPIGIFVGAFQVGCFWGPVFATVQELAPPKIRATVIAFYILALNLLGLAVGAVIAGLSIDYLKAIGNSQPFTWTLLGLSIFALLSLPCFLMASSKKYLYKENT